MTERAYTIACLACVSIPCTTVQLINSATALILLHCFCCAHDAARSWTSQHCDRMKIIICIVPTNCTASPCIVRVSGNDHLDINTLCVPLCNRHETTSWLTNTCSYCTALKYGTTLNIGRAPRDLKTIPMRPRKSD